MTYCGSLRVTPVAAAEPVLLMVTVKPARLPCVMVAESAVFITASCAALCVPTVTEQFTVPVWPAESVTVTV